ncbi:MAG: hypothetical protein HY815_26310 [Candidatus Riflebacteria bacterium]|nr:hypothetical protein [Candidatus Riflebacteria bacterium]
MPHPEGTYQVELVGAVGDRRGWVVHSPVAYRWVGRTAPPDRLRSELLALLANHAQEVADGVDRAKS